MKTFKTFGKWSVCLALVLSLVFTSIVASAQTVEYVYGSYGSYSKIIKNWGTREQDATYLSQNAIAFYNDNNTSYAELSALAGNSALNQTPNSALYKQLQELMKDNHKKLTSYGEIRYLSPFTDCQNSAKTSTKISSLYSGTGIGPSWDGGSTWNREHCWPKSKTAYKSVDNTDRNEATDIMTVRPTSSNENTSRGNKAYGTTTNSNYFNPNHFANGQYDLRGDCARMMLYTYVRWGNTSYMWGPTGVIESKEVLLQWMEEDPVDTWELGRNDSVQSITGVRNVFVDYPEYAWLLFGEEIPNTVTTPSGIAKSGTTQTPSGNGGNTNNNNTNNNTNNNNNTNTTTPPANNQGSNTTTSKPTTNKPTTTGCSHTETEVKNYVRETCVTNGYSGDKVCKECGATVEKGAATNPSGVHNFSDWKIVKEATKKEEGIRSHTCIDCGFTETSAIISGEDSKDKNDNQNADNEGKGKNKALIIIIVIGSVVILGGAAVVVIFLIREKKKLNELEAEETIE